MVGAVVHALRAERARFKHELDEYRREAAEATRLVSARSARLGEGFPEG